jgi:hypothetical protein
VTAVLLKVGTIMIGTYVVVTTGLVVTLGTAISQARKLARLISRWGQVQGLVHRSHDSHLMTGEPLKRRLLMVTRQSLHLGLAFGFPSTIMGFQIYVGQVMCNQGFCSSEDEVQDGTAWITYADVRFCRHFAPASIICAQRQKSQFVLQLVSKQAGEGTSDSEVTQ